MRRTLPPLIAVLVIALLPLAASNDFYLHQLVLIGIYAILLLGLDIVVGYTGEVSLGHAALFGVGSYTAGVLATKLGLPFPLALAAAIAVAALFGAVLALPALRVTGPYLAMVTLAFGTIVQILINEMTFLTEGPLGISLRKPALHIESLAWFHRLKLFDYYYVVAVVLLATLVVVNRVLRSHLGRAFEALRDSPIASDCMAVSVYRYKVYAFVVSAGLAGLAGALYTYSEEYISPNSYGFELTIQFLLAVMMGGRKSRSGPLLGAAIIVILPNLLSDIDLFRILAVIIAVAVIATALWTARRGGGLRRALVPVGLVVAFAVFSFQLQNITDFRLAIYGLMILGVVYYLPDGIVGWVRTMVAQIRPDWLRRAETVTVEAGAAWINGAGETSGDGAALLSATGVTMQFGGLKALNGVDLVVARGSVHGLIGPNGSGKSTMMNVLSGVYRPTAGTISLGGVPIGGLTPAAIAARGIARTFQNVQLFGEMSALQNVLVGLHHSYRSTFLDVALASPRWRREEAAARRRAGAILDFVGLAEMAGEEARNLPYGKQRMLEIGRALALDPKLLLLDEPAAGLTAPDIKVLLGVIGRIRDHGVTLILIEHHMDVVMAASDVVTVLDFGQKIAEGAPAAVQADRHVIEAYLGGAEMAVA